MKNTKYKTIFLVAWDYEIEKLFLISGFKKAEKTTPFEVYEKDNFGLIKMGIGKTLAAAATQWAIDNFEPKNWINIGFCGSLNDKFHFGDVTTVSDCRFHDLDIRGLRPEFGIGQTTANGEYLFKLKGATDFGLPTAKCITGDIFVVDKSKLSEIVGEYSPDLVEMELVAIVEVVKLNQQLEKFTSIKVISDNADESAGNDSCNVEEKMLKDIKKLIAKLIA